MLPHHIASRCICSDSATGSFQPALIALSVIAVAIAGLLLILRHQVRGHAIRTASAVA
jgi:hypothetical protein